MIYGDNLYRTKHWSMEPTIYEQLEAGGSQSCAFVTLSMLVLEDLQVVKSGIVKLLNFFQQNVVRFFFKWKTLLLFVGLLMPLDAPILDFWYRVRLVSKSCGPFRLHSSSTFARWCPQIQGSWNYNDRFAAKYLPKETRSLTEAVLRH